MKQKAILNHIYTPALKIVWFSTVLLVKPWLQKYYKFDSIGPHPPELDL